MYDVWDVKDCLQDYFKAEKLEEVKCDKCNGCKEKRVEIQDMPDQLVLILNRNDGVQSNKNHTEVKVPEKLNINGEDLELRISIHHQGAWANVGHYKTYLLHHEESG